MSYRLIIITIDCVYSAYIDSIDVYMIKFYLRITNMFLSDRNPQE